MQKLAHFDRLSRLIALGASATSVLCLSQAALAQGFGGHWELQDELFGTQRDDFFGEGVAGVGDLNQDGFPDFVVGAPGKNGTTSPEGKVYAYSGLDGSELWTWTTASSSGLGHAVASLGDVNGDGLPDVAVTEHWWASGPRGLRVFLSDGTLWASKLGFSFNFDFGQDIAGAGDLNGDGLGDIIVGEPKAFNGGGVRVGRVWVYSGFDGSTIAEILGVHPDGLFGFAVDGAGDVNGDGVPDVLAGAYSAEGQPGVTTGTAMVFSGATGALLHEVVGPTATWTKFGYDVSFAGDLDGDGLDDILIGAPWANFAGFKSGSVYAFSGATGNQIYRVDGVTASGRFGWSLASLGDVTADGIPDFLVGAVTDGFTDRVSVHSGADGALVVSIDGQRIGFGRELDTLGDLDGDGFPEFIVGASQDPGPPPSFSNRGAVYIYGLTPFISTDNSELPASPGGSVTVSLEFPQSEALRSYALLVSATGTGPSGVGGILIPLTADPLLNRMLTGWAPPNMTGALGVLDANAQATASIDSHPLLTPHVGRTFYVVAVTYDALTLTGRQSSVARPITVVP